MSLETRPPRELLAKIGLSGKEVVKIIKARGWDIVEPHGLQQQNLYYIPGAKEKEQCGLDAAQNEEFFVGEGELYAFILQQGGIRYLLPDEELSSESDAEIAPSQLDKAVETCAEGDEDSDDDDKRLQDSSDRRKWKRRKKLSTAKATNRTSLSKRPRQSEKQVRNEDEEEQEDEQEQLRVSSQVKLEQATYDAIGQQKELLEYQNSLKAQGWRAQLLKDIDVHLLRSTAAVDRRQRARESCTGSKKKSARPIDSVGPHAIDAAETRQEISGLMKSMRASNDDLSAMMEAVISSGEQLSVPDRIDVIGRIGIPEFVSTGLGSLVLIRDIERYLLLFVAAVRRYQRAREVVYASESTNELHQSLNRSVKREKLRALQLCIEESKRELLELAAIVATDAIKSCQDAAQDSVLEDCAPRSQTTLQESNHTTSRIVRADAPDA